MRQGSGSAAGSVVRKSSDHVLHAYVVIGTSYPMFRTRLPKVVHTAKLKYGRAASGFQHKYKSISDSLSLSSVLLPFVMYC